MEHEVAVTQKVRVRFSVWAALGAAVLALGALLIANEQTVAPHIQRARVASLRSLLGQLEQALAMYRNDHGHNPSELNELEHPGSRHGRYFEFKASQKNTTGRILDPWGHPIVYRPSPTGRPELYSVGPNGRDEGGKGDDITAD